MTYAESIQYLYDLQMFGAKFGLDNTFKLAALAGNPEKQLRFIHVAGTNGKGSTCAMLESIYRNAGLRVGLFTSPHLVSFSERIQVNRTLISEQDVIRLVTDMRDLLKAFSQDAHPTFFEVVTVMALRFFAEQRCDLVIWETGMGGRLDATNIVAPLASVITNVQLDHQKWLGETLAQIAFEKAGIIKAGVPVITAEQNQEALDVVTQTAKRLGAPCTVVDAAVKASILPEIQIPLLGEHQRTNAAVAYATVRALLAQIAVSNTNIREGLKSVFWPARLQVIETKGGRLLLDGAHNAAGVEALVSTLKTEFPDQKPTLVLGVLRDKQFGDMCRLLSPVCERIYLVPVGSERTTNPQELVDLCKAANPAADVHACESLRKGLDAAQKFPFVVITGSLYLIGEAMELLGISPAKNERGLNEWTAHAT